MAIFMIFMGLFGTIRSINDFTKNVATGRSNRIILRSEEPYAFWVYNTANFTAGIMCIALAIIFARAGYKSKTLHPNLIKPPSTSS